MLVGRQPHAAAARHPRSLQAEVGADRDQGLLDPAYVVDHPDVVQHYRAGHAVSDKVSRGQDVSTEDLRKAFVHYRALFGVLVAPETTERDRETADQERRATG